MIEGQFDEEGKLFIQILAMKIKSDRLAINYVGAPRAITIS